MSYPKDYVEIKSNKIPLIAGMLVGAIAGVTAWIIKSKQQETEVMEVTLAQPIPEGHEFYMPHFMLKNFFVSTQQDEAIIQVNYSIDASLNEYLKKHPKYKLQLKLPNHLHGQFRNIEDTVVGSTQLETTQMATFHYKSSSELKEMIDVTTGPYVLKILDESGVVKNEYMDVYSAVNIIRM